MKAIRVVVVDDSALVRGLLTDIVNREPGMRCVGAAADPLQAREMIRELDPDVVTLDVEMPRMDGLDFLGRLMRLRPTPVVMVSTLTERGAETTLRALELGAVDFVAKPSIGVADGLRRLADEITEKIRIASQARVQRAAIGPAASPTRVAAATPAGSAAPAAPAIRLRASTEKVVFVGASTGGTEATREVLQGLPADSPAVLITQHMPAGFTRSYAARLDAACALRVKEATDGERVLTGHAYVAPGGMHLAVAKDGANYVARVRAGEPVNRHMPSVEVLFESAARLCGPNAIGVMLTGMGGDGARAMRAMRDAGAWTVCQDEATSVVFGMPREAIAHGAACEVLPLGRIAAAIGERVRASGGAVRI